MANWSRGLLQLGEGVGQLAQNVATRERDAAMAAREENLARMQITARKEEQQAGFTHDETMYQTEKADRAAAEERGFKHAETLQKQGFAHDEAQDRGQRSFQLELEARKEKFMKEGWTRESQQNWVASLSGQAKSLEDEVKSYQKIIADKDITSEADATKVEKYQKIITDLQARQSALYREITAASQPDTGIEIDNASPGHGPPASRTAPAAAAAAPARTVAPVGSAAKREVAPASAPAKQVAPVASGVEGRLATLKPKGVDYSRAEDTQQRSERQRILQGQDRLSLEKLLRTGKISSKDKAMIREILADRSRQETRAALKSFKS